MDSRFTIQVLSQTLNPQQVIYAAMHQDYAEAFVWDDRAQFPDEPKAGELVIRNLLGGNRGHFGPLEHPQIVLNVGWFPHSCMQQIRTHRVGVSFDVQCLAGDTEVTFVKASGSLHKVKIAELHDLWSNGEQAVRERKIRGRNGEAPGGYRRDCKKRLQRMKLRVLNESTGAFEISHLQDVMCSGTQPVYRLTLADGKTLDCTTNHRLFTADGWQHMGDALGLVTDETNQVLAITRNCEVMCNGVLRTDAIYSQKSWFAAQAQKGLTASEIAASAGCSVAVIRHWAKEHGIALSAGHQRGLKTIVGDGLYRDRHWLEAQLKQGQHTDAMAAAAGCSIECIKKWVYHHGLALNKRPPGSPNPWNKGNGGYALNHESLAYEFDNLVSVCKPFHEQIHSEHREAKFAQDFQPMLDPQTWQPKPSPVGRKLMAHPVKVVQVEYLGMHTTYDLEVAGEWHNFVANGVVVHNSFRYTGTRILAVAEGQTAVEEVFYLRPLGFYTDRQGKKYEYRPEQRDEDLAWCLAGAKLYKTRIDQGFAEEHARSLIPFDVRQHWVMSANVRSIMHLLDLRAKGDAQLEAQQMCELIWPHFEAWVPAIAEWYHKQRWAKARLSP